MRARPNPTQFTFAAGVKDPSPRFSLLACLAPCASRVGLPKELHVDRAPATVLATTRSAPTPSRTTVDSRRTLSTSAPLGASLNSRRVCPVAPTARAATARALTTVVSVEVSFRRYVNCNRLASTLARVVPPSSQKIAILNAARLQRLTTPQIFSARIVVSV